MKIKDEVLKFKSIIIVITYTLVLALILFKLPLILNFLYRVIRILDPLFYGLIMAFVLNIPMVKIENYLTKHFGKSKIIQRFKRVIAITLAFLIVSVICIVFGKIVVPEIINSISRLITNFAAYFDGLINNIDNILAYLNIDAASLEKLSIEELFLHFGIDYTLMIHNFSNWLLGTSFDTIEQLFNFFGITFNLFMGLVICFYLLGSKEKFILQTKKLLYAVFKTDVANQILYHFQVSNEIFKDFVGGRLLEVFVVGLLVYALMVIFKIEFAPLIASMCAIATIIPVFGSLIVNIIAIILLLSVEPIDALIFVIIYQVVMNLDGNFIYPKFISKSLGLPAVWILISVILFGGLFGAFGMLIAVPLTACLYTFASNFINARLKAKQIVVK